QIQYQRNAILERAHTYAQSAAFNALSSVVFDDDETETQRLRSLRSTSFIEHVHIYKMDDITGDLSFFASYNRRGLAPIPAKFSELTKLGTPRIRGDYVETAEAIRLDEDVVGYVYLRA